MCAPSIPKPDPRLAGFVAPKQNITNVFKSELTRYTDMEDLNDYYKREIRERTAWRNVAGNRSKDIKEFYSGFSRKRGEEGMTARESAASWDKRQKEERAAFDAGAGKDNETNAAYKARVKAAQQEYINRPVAGAPGGTGAAGATGIPGATGAPTVTSTDRMATKLKQKTASSRARASGRRMLRIGR